MTVLGVLVLVLPASAAATFSPLAAWSTTFHAPDAIALVPGASGAAQGVWVAEDTGSPPGDDVQELDLSGANQRTIASTFTCQGTNETFDDPSGLAVDPSTDDLFVGDHGDNRVIEFDPTGAFMAQIGGGEVSTTCGTPASPDTGGSGPGFFDSTTGLSVSAGQLFVASPGSDCGASGNTYVDEVAVPLSESNLETAEIGLGGAYGQAVSDPATADLYTADSAPNLIHVFTLSGTDLGFFSEPGNAGDEFSVCNPQWLAIDPGAGVLYAVDTGNDAIYTFNLNTGAYLQQLTGLDTPQGVAVDPVGHVLYVVERGSTNSVARYSYTPAPTCTPATATSGGGQVSLPVSCTDQAGAPITYSLTSQPAHGSATINPASGQLSYTPNSGYEGADSVTYDGASIDGTSRPATVSLAVAPPSCSPQTLAAGYEAPLQVTLSCSGGPASYRIVAAPANGTLSTVGGGGTLTYTPNNNFAGADSFTYEGVSSAGLASAATTVTVQVGTPLTPPVAGQSANVYYASGTVTVTLPGSHKPIPLTAGMQVPLGSIIDATHGRVGVFVENAAGLQSADFYRGEFRLTQSASSRGSALARRASAENYTLLTLLGRRIPRARCATYAKSFSGAFKLAAVADLRAAKRHKRTFQEHGKPVRQLWGDGHGDFATVGNGSSSSVRGTLWAIFDYPDGTLTRVYTDSVTVYDVHLHRTVVVHAGHFYFAALGNLRPCR